MHGNDMTKNTITITAMARPALFADMLHSLSACGLDGWHIYIALDPSPVQASFAPICAEVLDPSQYTLIVNETRLGVRENPKSVIDRAFAEGSDFNLCLEEDFLIAPDALELAQWYKLHHRDHWTALNLVAGSCMSKGNLSHRDSPDTVFETRCFNSIGVGLTRTDWERLRPAWSHPKKLRRGGYYDLAFHGWDISLYEHVLKSSDLRVVQPVLARCTHTGTEGMHCDAVFQAQAFEGMPIATHVPNPSDAAAFNLSAVDDLPYAARAHVYCQWDAAERLAEMNKGLAPRRNVVIAALSRLKRRLLGRAV